MKKIDIAKLKSFLLYYCFKLELPSVNDEEVEYIMKFYSERGNSIDIDQFQALVETLVIAQFIDSREFRNYYKT